MNGNSTNETGVEIMEKWDDEMCVRLWRSVENDDLVSLRACVDAMGLRAANIENDNNNDNKNTNITTNSNNSVNELWTTCPQLRNNATGETVLHVAVGLGHAEIVAFLLWECRCTAQTRSNRSVTPLHTAIDLGYAPIASLLLTGYTTTTTSTTTTNASTTTTTLPPSVLACPYQVDGDGWTALHTACRLGNNNLNSHYMIQLILTCCNKMTAGSNHNDVTTTATASTSSLSSSSFVSILHQRDCMGRTPLHIATQCNNSTAVMTLLQHAQLQQSNNNNNKVPRSSPLQALVNCQDRQGRTALHYAVFLHREKVVSILINMNNNNNNNDLAVAAVPQQQQNQLQQNQNHHHHRQQPNHAAVRSVRTPPSSFMSFKPVLQHLVNAGADLFVRDKYGLQPIQQQPPKGSTNEQLQGLSWLYQAQLQQRHKQCTQLLQHLSLQQHSLSPKQQQEQQQQENENVEKEQADTKQSAGKDKTTTTTASSSSSSSSLHSIWVHVLYTLLHDHSTGTNSAYDCLRRHTELAIGGPTHH